MHSLLAPAKINLALHVGALRGDGFHDLASLAVFTSFGDEIIVQAADGLLIEVEGPFASTLASVPMAENLVFKAAKMLREVTSTGAGAKITLVKNLPPASGIGGGTADATATLVALDNLWGTGLTPTRFARLAFRLGADGPLCMYPHFAHHSMSAVMTGAGEHVIPGPILPTLYLCLVNPGVSVSTGAIFRYFDRQMPAGASTQLPPLSKRFSKPDLMTFLAHSRNDLMAPAMGQAPVIKEVLVDLAAAEGCHFARMSGSGATCFGVFSSKKAAHRAAQNARHKKRWAISTPIQTYTS